MTESLSEERDRPDVMQILVATDIHLGYNEKDSVRGNDSFIAFEEILQLAIKKDVDFILLGGDLFHDAKPSANSMQRCMKLLRTYTLGDRPIKIEFLSDQSVNFMESLYQRVNYEDPNMNIAYPVFSIHGNHDDPSGFGRLSALDLLSTNGLINYFGKWTDLTQIKIAPILLKKGTTQLALYGLSHIHDARLARLFHDDKVVFEVPSEDTGKWFNMLVLHQNRADRGPKNFLPEQILPPMLNLVIWGHEHDCRIVPEENELNNFYVSQPGSSVATSLSEGESLDKHVGLLSIYGDTFRMEPIRLETVRPFIFDSINLNDLEDELDLDELDDVNKVQAFVKNKVAQMMKKAEEKHTGHADQPIEPLIRLRITYSKEEHMFNYIRFGQQYTGQVANAMDMILFKKVINRKKDDANVFDEEVLNNAYDRIDLDSSKIEDVVEQYFREAPAEAGLEVMLSKSMNEMCRLLVDCNDEDSAELIIKLTVDMTTEHLTKQMPAENEIENELVLMREQEDDMYQAILKVLDAKGVRNVPNPNVGGNNSDEMRSDDDDDIPKGRNATNAGRGVKANITKSAAKTRGQGRGRSANRQPTTSNAKSERGRGSDPFLKPQGGRKAANSNIKASDSDIEVLSGDDDFPQRRNATNGGTAKTNMTKSATSPATTRGRPALIVNPQDIPSTSTSSPKSGRGRGSRGGRAAPGASKAPLNITITPTKATTIQPSIQQSFSSQTTRSSQPLKKSARLTQYISDSDSN